MERQNTEDIEDIDRRIGFSRPEMCGCADGDHVGTLDIHLKTHVLVSTRIPFDQWNKDASNVLVVTEGKKKKDKGEKKENCFFAPDLTEGTVWVFAQHDFKKNPMTVTQYPSLAAYNNATGIASGTSVTQYDVFVFVCCHTQRDERCAFCGPVLLREVSESAATLGISSRVGVFAINHVGGHKFAGNVLVYTRRAALWYGYVCPQDVMPMMRGVLSSRGVAFSSPPPLPHLLRGVMGLSVEDQVAHIKDWRLRLGRRWALALRGVLWGGMIVMTILKKSSFKK